MEMSWYVLQVRVGCEQKVQQLIQKGISARGLGDQIGDILLPSEQITKIEKGKKVKLERKLYPGYLMIQMINNEDVIQIIKGTRHVYNFLGGKAPEELPADQIRKVTHPEEHTSASSKRKMIFEVGEQVRVCSGPFTSFSGSVEEVNSEKERLRILVSIFDRATPVELDYSQVEKIG